MRPRDLKNTKQGKTAYLIGNGPSLSLEELDRLVNMDTFAMNNIVGMFSDTQWRPTYYVAVASAWKHPVYRLKMIEGINASQVAFVDEKWVGLKNQKVVYLSCYDEETHFTNIDWRNWSDDLEQGVCKWGSSMYATMQIACYMGYKELRFIGVDGFYTGVQEMDHYTPDYSIEAPRALAHETNRDMVITHLMALINCMRLGVQVYNHSRGGKLTVYSR